MRVALIGSGGREHALALKIAKSRNLQKLFILAGNPGTKYLGENVSLNLSDADSLLNFCSENKIDLVIIGPEQPLVDGMADILRSAGIAVFGPSKEAARLEGEKSYSKDLMKRFGVPTAGYQIYYKDDYNATIKYLTSCSYPIVIKADGLAAGKGVAIPESYNEAVRIIDDYFNKSVFGVSGHKIVIEEFLKGEEASVFVITDGENYILLPPAQDHKRALDGDKGKNTGGMGAYAPAPIVTKEVLQRVEDTIVKPMLEGMSGMGNKYTGCLYCGLMIEKGIPSVVEFNCRFGDPETQVVLPLLEGDFLELLYSSAIGNLNKDAIKYNGGSSVCVVAASGGYPDEYDRGKLISGLDSEFTDVIIYHAGTKESDGKIYTNGGRVLGITSFLKNKDLSLAKKTAYAALSRIDFDGMQYRKDIADKAIK